MSSGSNSRPAPAEVTRLLQAIDDGDPLASEQLLPLVYTELRDLARARMNDEKPGQTLTPTALVHEVYLRLLKDSNPGFANKAHFFAAAAQAMRRILIEIARRKAAVKHGGEYRRQPLTDLGAIPWEQPQELCALDESLKRLEAADERMANVVKLHFFAGLSLDEVAQALDVSSRTVSRLWRSARAWLYDDMRPAS
ncbi:MAG: ECF-type sigma factor [Pseudomonadota bacterium]